MKAGAIKDGLGFCILKVVQVVIGGVYTVLMLFYLGIILPEYLACLDCDSEGAMGTDFWGNPVQCFGDSKVFGQVLFDFLTLIIVGFSIVLIVLISLARFKSNK